MLPPSRQVLILGARGRLGYHCVRAFAQANWRVLAHVRKGSSLPTGARPHPQAIIWTDIDLQNPAALDKLIATHGEVHVVINAMAAKFSTSDWKRELLHLTHMALDVAKHTDALLIKPLSVLGYGTALPEVLYEGQHLFPPEAPYICKLRAQSEIHMKQFAVEHGIRLCTLRIGTLYGHTGWGWISTAVGKSLKQGSMHWLGPYNVATPWAYAPDVAQTIERIAQASNNLGLLTQLHFAGHHVSGNDWHAAMQASGHHLSWLAANTNLQKDQVRWWMWKPASWFSPVIRALSQMEHIWRMPHRLDNTRLLELIGAEVHTPWQVSIDRTVALLNYHDDLRGGLVRTHAGY